MTDMPGWRAWADAAHRSSLSTYKPKKRVLFRCTSCNARTTKNQAKGSGGKCIHCRNWLRAFKPQGGE